MPQPEQRIAAAASVLMRTLQPVLSLVAVLVMAPASATAQPLPVQGVQSVHAGPQVDRPHSPYIKHMLKAQYHLDIKQHHSQLIVATRPISRIAITSPETVNFVQYSPTEVALIGLELGRTDLALWFTDDPNPAIYELTVVRDDDLEQQLQVDFGRLEKKLAMLFPDSNVYLIPISNQVVVKGQAHDAEAAARILQIVRAEVATLMPDFPVNGQVANGGIVQAGFVNGQNGLGNGTWGDQLIVNMLEVPGEFQVMLRVRIAELNRSRLRRMGVDWRVLLNRGRHAVATTMGGALGNLSGVFENGEISVMLNWLEARGTISFLAEPALTVMSGHPASFLSGGEFAVPTIIGLGGGQNTTFRGYGTSLIVTPTVLDKDLIRLQIVPEFSQIDESTAVSGIPGTNVRRVQTVVELREGQTIAIGGLISRRTSTEVDRVPFIGGIPVIGSYLFSAKRATEDETELLIIVTPEIVRPMDADEVPPMPNFYVTHPNHDELYKYGQTEGRPNTGVYQVAPYGTGNNQGQNVGYSLFSPPVRMPGGGAGGTPARNWPLTGEDAVIPAQPTQPVPYDPQPLNPPGDAVIPNEVPGEFQPPAAGRLPADSPPPARPDPSLAPLQQTTFLDRRLRQPEWLRDSPTTRSDKPTTGTIIPAVLKSESPRRPTTGRRPGFSIPLRQTGTPRVPAEGPGHSRGRSRTGRRERDTGLPDRTKATRG